MPIVFKVTTPSNLQTELTARYLLTSNYDDSVSGDSATAVSSPTGVSSEGFLPGPGYLSMPSSFSSAMNWDTGDGTISFWNTFTETPPSNNTYLLSDREGSGATTGELSFYSSGDFIWFTRNYGGSAPSTDHLGPYMYWDGRSPDSGLDVTSPFQQNHIVLVRDTSTQTIRVYVDGDEKTSVSFPNTLTWGHNNTNVWRLGNYDGGTYYNWRGRVADMAVWKGRVLTSSEITELYNKGQGGSY